MAKSASVTLTPILLVRKWERSIMGNAERGETAAAVALSVRLGEPFVIFRGGGKVEFWRDPIRYPHCENQFTINKFAYGIEG
jgi:hypothetical protein